jgi:hypothetical protein
VRAFIVLRLNHTAVSVIEEKGEGFENGKNSMIADVA